MKETCFCNRCGVEFVGLTGQKYCSKKCADRASQDRCGGVEPQKLSLEYSIEQAKRRQERLAMKKRLAARDAAYAAAFPDCASGAERGQRFSGTFGKREQIRMVDVNLHKCIMIKSEAANKVVARKRQRRSC